MYSINKCIIRLSIHLFCISHRSFFNLYILSFLFIIQSQISKYTDVIDVIL